MNNETYEEIVSRLGEPIFRHTIGSDYDFEGRGDWACIPCEIMVMRHSNEENGGVILFARYSEFGGWHANDSAGTRFFIREVLNGRISVNPIQEPWSKKKDF